jgi:hypothetical protein
MTLPVDPAGSSDPGSLVIGPPPPPPGKPFGGGADRLLRPIPLSPEGVRGRSSTGSRPRCTRGSSDELRRTPISSGSSTTRPLLLHNLSPRLHRKRARLLTSGPDQVRARARRSRARSARRSSSVRLTSERSDEVSATSRNPVRRQLRVVYPGPPSGRQNAESSYDDSA